MLRKPSFKISSSSELRAVVGHKKGSKIADYLVLRVGALVDDVQCKLVPASACVHAVFVLAECVSLFHRLSSTVFDRP